MGRWLGLPRRSINTGRDLAAGRGGRRDGGRVIGGSEWLAFGWICCGLRVRCNTLVSSERGRRGGRSEWVIGGETRETWVFFFGMRNGSDAVLKGHFEWVSWERG